MEIGKDSIHKPAPKGWRRFENAMLLAIIPAATTMVQSWGFKDETMALRLNLLIAVGLSAIIKGIGMIVSNGETYAKEKDNS